MTAQKIVEDLAEPAAKAGWIVAWVFAPEVLIIDNMSYLPLR